MTADLVLPSASDFSEVSEATLKDPLPWDVVPAAPYERLNRVEPYVAALRERSDRRRAAEKPFTALTDDVARLKKSLASKSISLNEAQRRQEMAESKLRESELASEQRALRAKGPTSYEITLKNAALPGLPPPVAPVAPLAVTDKAPAKDEDSDAKIRTTTDDLILNEGVEILADYVNALQPPVEKTPRTRRTEAASLSGY